MAVKVKSVEQFSSVFQECIALEKSKRGLGNRFHDAVITLLNENPNATPDELAKLYSETMTEVENTLSGELKEAFGEDAEPKDLGAWTQYKSNYKNALKKVDRRDILRCSGPGQLNQKLNEVRKALKEKEEAGLSDGNPADNGGGKAGKRTGLEVVPEGIRDTIGEALWALAQLNETEQSEVAENFKRAAFRNLKTGKKKAGATIGDGTAEKVAASA